MIPTKHPFLSASPGALAARVTLILIMGLVLFHSVSVKHSIPSVRQLAIAKKPIRVLGIGSSWRHKEASSYPSLLEPLSSWVVTERSPYYITMCTQNSFKDQSIFDVILLEFSLEQEGLAPLAMRLRQRWPKATIIFVQLWNPLLYTHKASGLNYVEWIESHQFSTFDDTKLHRFLYKYSSPSDWESENQEDASQAQNEAAATVNGIVWTLPRPTDPRIALIQYGYLFSAGGQYLTPTGHHFVASSIRTLINNLELTPSNEIGSWRREDECHNWVHTANVTLEYSNMELHKVSSTVHALSVSASPSTLSIHNPFQQPKALYLSYLTKPSYSCNVWLHNHFHVTMADNINETSTDWPTKTGFAGVIPAGDTQLFLQTNGRQRPFYLIGVALVSPDQGYPESFY